MLPSYELVTNQSALPMMGNFFDRVLDKSRPVNIDTSMPEVTLEKKEERRENCGKFLGSGFKMDGAYDKSQRYRCNLWREAFCPSCSAWRQKQARRRTLRALDQVQRDERTLKKVITDDAGARSLCARLNKDEYIRLPQADGSFLFIIDSDKVLDNNKKGTIEVEEVYDDIDLEEIDWEQVVQTPGNKRVTGSLGKNEEEALPDDQVEIRVPKIVVHPDTTPEQETEALVKTFELTKHLDPQTPEELEEALDERTETFVKVLKVLGGNLLHGISHKRVRIGIIGIPKWSIYRLNQVELMVSSGHTPDEATEPLN